MPRTPCRRTQGAARQPAAQIERAASSCPLLAVRRRVRRSATRGELGTDFSPIGPGLGRVNPGRPTNTLSAHVPPDDGDDQGAGACRDSEDHGKIPAGSAVSFCVASGAAFDRGPIHAQPRRRFEQQTHRRDHRVNRCIPSSVMPSATAKSARTANWYHTRPWTLIAACVVRYNYTQIAT